MPTVEEVVACLNQIAPGQVVVAREWLTIQDAIFMLSALEKDAWQPITTAPKDTEVFIGCWSDGEWKFGRSLLFFERGNEFEGENYSGWFWSIDDCLDHVAENPTHWRPLPEPPAIDLARGAVVSMLDEIRARDADSTVAAATDGPWYFAGAPKSRLYEIRTKLCDNPGSGCKRGELICRHVDRAADANLIAHAVETAFDRRTLLALLEAQSLELQAVREALEKYGRHADQFCIETENGCDCGFDAALKQSRGA